MGQDSKEQLKVIMDRLRARLFNHFEAMGFGEQQLKANKKSMKDITSDTWNNLSELLDKYEEK